MKTVYYLIVSILMLTIGCNSETAKQKDEIANIPDAGPPKCGFHDAEAFNLSLGSYVGRKGITYYVANKPTYMDSTKAVDVIKRAWSAWQEHIEVPFINRTWDSAHAEIIIKFENLDGRGGELGQSEFPPTEDLGYHQQRNIIFDNYDVAGSREGSPAFDFFTIAVHEFGHSCGLKHCDDDDAVMFWQYHGITTGLSIDDIAGVREKYNKHVFTDKYGRKYKYFVKNQPGKASKYFYNAEFYTKCQYQTGHYLDSSLIPSITIIRDHYGIPIKILSSYRTHECNNIAGGATRSRHMKFDALDWKFTGPHAVMMHDRYIDDIRNKGIVFQKLFDAGIRGFGSYATSNHIDTRENGNMLTWKGKFYNTWGRLNDRALWAPDFYGVEKCE